VIFAEKPVAAVVEPLSLPGRPTYQGKASRHNLDVHGIIVKIWTLKL